MEGKKKIIYTYSNTEQAAFAHPSIHVRRTNGFKNRWNSLILNKGNFKIQLFWEYAEVNLKNHWYVQTCWMYPQFHFQIEEWNWTLALKMACVTFLAFEQALG